MVIRKLLLASHGTPGARAAEDAALALCRESGASLHQLFVVPDLWKGMMGDDWLNNDVTRARFGEYVENQLAREAAAEIERLAARAEESGISRSDEIRLGKPAACLIDVHRAAPYDLIVVGSPRPKGHAGLRSRMDPERLIRSLTAPLMTVPHPDR